MDEKLHVVTGAEAIAFYKKAVGAKVEMMMRYNESPEPAQPGTVPAGMENKVMHATLRIGDAAVAMSDGGCSGKVTFGGFALTLVAADEAEAERSFAALGDGGKVQMPLGKTFFSRRFGMLTDRFGVKWMVIVHG